MKLVHVIEGWEPEEIEPAENCPICASAIARPAFNAVIDMEEGVAGAWFLSECAGCRSLYLDPRPSELALPKAYDSYYTHEFSPTENVILNSRTISGRVARGYLVSRYGLPRRGDEIPALAALIRPLRLQLDYFMRHLPSSRGSLLDVGCGSGGFISRALAAGWNVEGVEPDPKAALAARSQASVPVHASLNDLAGRQFDVITMSHVVEHLHDPRSILLRTMSLLAPGGMVWIAVPNVRGLGRRLYGSGWQALEVPRHISIPSAEGLIGLLQSVGFRTVELRCRGRGSAKRFTANERRRGSTASPFRAALASWAVDCLASIFPRAAEELVIVARREHA